ncbi:helicase-related protein [Thermoflexus sp.]|uniref:helicase-related protein n=1 Tax=Thermoflexus sp. TaxID=1969742 RepID=UPI002ADDA3C9|nr:helicase-related protein [Thermoflexus sp.]
MILPPAVGSIVRARGREWVLLPSPQPDVLLLRPLAGGEAELCGIYLPLIQRGVEHVEPAAFPLPTPDGTADAVAAELLWNAARLTLRDGAGPFRSLGRISVRPRPYQFVPLLMALRMSPVRMLIADDVGVGKTIEALLIARELLARGEIRRIAVLCPPYLCDQWARELEEKFHLPAVVIRSGTVGPLERKTPPGESIFGHYPHIVVSIDYAKSDRHRANFLQHCPEFVIVDEAHGAAQPAGQRTAQQQRHQLLRDLAQDPRRHLLLLTATPHSGVEESFRSLLALLRPDFATLDLHGLNEQQTRELARHLVQRRRADVVRWLGTETPFPERESVEETYDLSPAYARLFEQVYAFSRELVRTGTTLTGWKRRIRYWSALALLRCVMSSPAAAQAALEKRMHSEEGLALDEEASDEAYAPYIYESSERETVDVAPAHIVEEGEREVGESDRRRLREFARLAASLRGSDNDRKIVRCAQIVAALLREGYAPIIWCRYIATSDYVAEELRRRLPALLPDIGGQVRVISVTGALSEDERRERVAELTRFPLRVLVATDCLSEGINLQEHFNAVVHYDLPWNPNRLEQREGRVDRFGQPAPRVKAVLLYGRDNPVDGAVLDVLLRKAQEIRRTLGVAVPVPVDSETVMEAVLNALFFHVPTASRQLVLPMMPAEVADLHRRWEADAQRERESRTRFAQHDLRPEEVARELEETDAVLGDPKAVQRFVLNGCQRLGAVVEPEREGVWWLRNLKTLPEMIQAALPPDVAVSGEWRVCFEMIPHWQRTDQPPTVLGRHHPFVEALARYFLEAALAGSPDAPAPRTGVVRTSAVPRRTVLLLLRLRFLLESGRGAAEGGGGGVRTLLAEEVRVVGLRGLPPSPVEVMEGDEPLALLQNLKPEAPVSPRERREALEEVLAAWNDLQAPLRPFVEKRAARLEEAHRRVRAAADPNLPVPQVRPHWPPDLLGVLVLMPIPKGVAR